MVYKLVVVHLIDTLQKGGAERLLIDSVNYLQNYHPEIKQYICTLRSKEDEISVPTGVERINLSLSTSNFVSPVKTLERFIKEKQVTILHAHLIDSILFSRLVKNKKVKKVFTYHNFYHDKDFAYYSLWRAWIDRLTFRKKYTSIYVSDEIRECIEKITGAPGHSYVLNNFPNPAFHYLYQVKNFGSLDAVIVANLRKTKNLELAAREMNHIKELPIRIHIYGEGPLRPVLEKEIRETGVKIQLHGRHEITSELLAQYDVFLMTSKSEGLPLSLLEAMTTGLPSLLPDHLSVFKKIAESSSEFYSITKDGHLGVKLKHLLEHKKQLGAMSKQAKENASSFSIEKYIEQLLSIYQR